MQLKQLQSNPKIWNKAIKEFESEAYFECHESLEQLWMQATGNEKRLLQALIQITVAYHHWRKNNFKGAGSILSRASKILHEDLFDWPLDLQRQAVTMAQQALVMTQDIQPPPWRHYWSQLSTDPVEPSSELC